MQAVAQRVAALAPDVRVACAYLELTEPDLPTVCQQLVQGGVSAITVVPMFLGVGRHARHDLPELLSALALAHPTLRLSCQAAVGEQAEVVEALALAALR